jgi:hypothetical protein
MYEVLNTANNKSLRSQYYRKAKVRVGRGKGMQRGKGTHLVFEKMVVDESGEITVCAPLPLHGAR